MILKYFRYAPKAIGNQASYTDIAVCMNRKAAQEGCSVNGNPPKFNTTNVYRWFKQLDGKEKSPKEKPALTPDMKRERIKWCNDMKDLIEELGDKFYACFLDEKWFYITSRRRKIKILSAQPGENADKVAPNIPTTRRKRLCRRLGRRSATRTTG